jgi:uncharacterized membrane protein YphA (DoxX/SURF4 family)
LVSGFNHFIHIDRIASYAASKKIPFPKTAVLLSGIVIIFGALCVLLGIWVKLGALLLALFLLATSFFIHNFWTVQDPSARSNSKNQFLKDLALAGASFLIWYFGTGPMSIM